MTIKEIVVAYLRRNEFDGLSCDECCCFVDGLMACDETYPYEGPRSDCTPGHKIPCPNPGECDCKGKSPHIGKKLEGNGSGT